MRPIDAHRVENLLQMCGSYHGVIAYDTVISILHDVPTVDVPDTNVGDLISRQALMKEFSDFVKRSNNSDFVPTPTWNDAVSLVGSMPSAEPERYMVTMAEPMNVDRLKGIITKASDVTLIPLPKAEPRWIPVTEQTLPRHNSVVVVYGNKGTWDYGTYRGHTPRNINLWNWKKNTLREVHWWMYKEDALPKPWKGESDG